MNINIHEIIDIGKKIVVEGGKQTLPYFAQYQNKYAKGNTSYIEKKDDNSPVTEADKKTELWIREKLHEHFPKFGIIGEEFGDNSETSEFCWVIDPIDGTRGFITGVPLYTTLLALIHTRTHLPIAGFIYAPVTDELMYAADGSGAWYNDTQTKVEQIDCIEQATLVSYDWQAVLEKSSTLLEMNHRAETVRTWGDGYGYMLLASGRAHAVIDPRMHMWDIMPVYPIVKEAGGIVAAWEQEDIDWFSNDIDCIATVNQKLLDIIRENV